MNKSISDPHFVISFNVLELLALTTYRCQDMTAEESGLHVMS
jgi:hypothetical protein